MEASHVQQSRLRHHGVSLRVSRSIKPGQEGAGHPSD